MLSLQGTAADMRLLDSLQKPRLTLLDNVTEKSREAFSLALSQPTNHTLQRNSGRVWEQGQGGGSSIRLSSTQISGQRSPSPPLLAGKAPI